MYSPLGTLTTPAPQIVFAGLDIFVPLLSLELLKFPKLCRAYFALLAHMMEVGPAACQRHACWEAVDGGVGVGAA